ncbi:MAG TPA: PilZ domain-containing protein [Hyphomicrobium sp.]|nr:PilZ domain-containing protein [Hyphomicrobium sp.]
MSMKRSAAEIPDSLVPDPSANDGLAAVQRMARMRRWMEQRLWRRYDVHIPVAVMSGDVRRIAIVSDISAKGLCLSGVEEFEVGDAVTITMREFEPLTGKIVWAAGDRAGVLFDSSLLT